ncbi:replication/maintenance protein RepL [Oribacterium sinus]
MFRTIIPLKRIATQEVGRRNVPHDVPHNKQKLIEFIKEKVRQNNKVTRQEIAATAGVSIKTVQRNLKEIKNLRYRGSGNNGYWELDE